MDLTLLYLCITLFHVNASPTDISKDLVSEEGTAADVKAPFFSTSTLETASSTSSTTPTGTATAMIVVTGSAPEVPTEAVPPPLTVGAIVGAAVGDWVAIGATAVMGAADGVAVTVAEAVFDPVAVSVLHSVGDSVADPPVDTVADPPVDTVADSVAK